MAREERSGLEQASVPRGMPRCVLHAFALLLGSCATPAVQVAVPTMTVAEAWNAESRAELAGASGRLVPAQGNPGVPYPVISAPDIRLAYIKPWKDENGNRHFGSWVAIQVEAPRWVLPDGSVDSIDARGSLAPPAARGRRD